MPYSDRWNPLLSTSHLTAHTPCGQCRAPGYPRWSRRSRRQRSTAAAVLLLPRETQIPLLHPQARLASPNSLNLRHLTTAKIMRAPRICVSAPCGAPGVSRRPLRLPARASARGGWPLLKPPTGGSMSPVANFRRRTLRTFPEWVRLIDTAILPSCSGRLLAVC
jgi:hypothetical protein